MRLWRFEVLARLSWNSFEAQVAENARARRVSSSQLRDQDVVHIQ